MLISKEILIIVIKQIYWLLIVFYIKYKFIGIAMKYYNYKYLKLFLFLE